MVANGDEFPTRLLKIRKTLGLAAAVDPNRINQHVEGLPDGTRAMEPAEIETLLKDPFARLVLRNGVFPNHLGEILDAFAAHDGTSDELPFVRSFLIAEGGQIPFQAGVRKGSTRLITVLSQPNGSPEIMISTLMPAGIDPRSPDLLNEIQAWDQDNQTFHYYQRQQGAWFWCGQSDMALVEPTRGEGAFDSHINGYPLMKELRTPWVHWHGPGLGISEIGYAPDDPLLKDALFNDRDHALNFEVLVIRPLMQRWNKARFDKHIDGSRLTKLRDFFRQLLVPTSANLISTHVQWADVAASGRLLHDIPPSFFFDREGLATTAGLRIDVPPLEMAGTRYRELVERFDLRVIGDDIDMPGDVPFVFTVPERAEEDQLASRILVQRGVMSERLAACLLMVDFPNPVHSKRRAALVDFAPESIAIGRANPLDSVFVNAVRKAAPASGTGPLREFLANWDIGPDDWEEVFATRVEAYLANVSTRLGQKSGSEDIFRLAESRRREFRQRPLAEFGLSLPQATKIAATTKPLLMNEQGRLA